MARRYRVLGAYRGGSDMRVGSLVKNKEYDYVGVVTYVDLMQDSYLVRWADLDVYDYYSACELEVLCE